MGTVNRTRMYAHVYFDLRNDQLKIAVYSIAKIPNFSGKLPESLKQRYGHSNAYDVFTQTLREEISPDEIQSGKAFSHSRIQDKLEALETFSRQFNPDSKMLVDLDSEKFWEEFLEAAYPKVVLEQFRALPEELKKQALGQLRKDNFLGKIEKATTAEDLQNILIEIYNDISRAFYRRTGGKEYAGSTYKFPTPPTFLASKELDMAYYPGYRGAQYMAVHPESQKMIHPVQAPDEEKWHTTIIEDTKIYTDNNPLKGNYDIVALDSIVDSLALLFYDKIKNFGNKDLTYLNFQSATNPLKETAKKRLLKLKLVKKALFSKLAGLEGDLVSVWVDLSNGQIFDSKSELLASKSQKEEKMLAANKILNLLKASRKESK